MVLSNKAIVDKHERTRYRFTMSSISPREEAIWQTVGFANPIEGLLGAGGFPIRPWGSAVRPRIEGDLLVHDFVSPDEARAYWDQLHEEEKRPSADGILDAFIRLEQPDDVRRFAQKWGVLDLCEHLVPNIHNHPFIYGMRGCRALISLKRSIYWEPLDRWFFYAQSARSALNVAAALQAGKVPETGDSDRLRRWIPTVYQAPDEPTDWWQTEPVADVLETIVNAWLLYGGVRPALQMRAGEPSMTFYIGTFGVIGLQLMQVITKVQGLALCSSCGIPYPRTGRRPQAGRRNYCPNCGRGAALRDAQRSYTQRKREQTRGQAQG